MSLSRPITGSNTQRGAGLIEVLVAALIMGIGLLGILSLQGKAIQNSQQSYTYSTASLLIQDIAERMMSNPEGNYAASAADKDCAAAACDADTLAKADKYQWEENIEQELPGGKGEITGTTEYTVTLEFNVERGGSKDQLVLVVSP